MKNIANVVKKTFTEKYLFPLYSFLFIFSMINREFLFFGLDLRYILLPLGLLLLIRSGLNNAKKIEKKVKDPIFTWLVLFFVWCLFSNVSWLWNGLDIKIDQMINQNILIINNLLAVIVYKKYSRYINHETIKKLTIISCIILVASFVLTGLGYTLDQISGSSVRSYTASSEIVEQKNIYGGDIRLAGYAEDANYASVFMIIGALSAFKLKTKKKIIKYPLALLFLIAFGFACSKTVLAAIIIGAIYIPIRKSIKIEKNRKCVDSIFLLFITALMFILPKISLFSSMDTMTNRYILWDVAADTYSRSPIIGNGISSARSAIDMKFGYWYIQPHSNYWQILAETGIIGLILFLVLSVKRLNRKIQSSSDVLAVLMLIVFGVTCEIIQLQMFVYVFYIMVDDAYEKRGGNKNED